MVESLDKTIILFCKSFSLLVTAISLGDKVLALSGFVVEHLDSFAKLVLEMLNLDFELLDAFFQLILLLLEHEFEVLDFLESSLLELEVLQFQELDFVIEHSDFVFEIVFLLGGSIDLLFKLFVLVI